MLPLLLGAVACGTSNTNDPEKSSVVLHLGAGTGMQPHFSNADSLTVKRIIVIPFVKRDESLSDDNENFVPDLNLMKQRDIVDFPVRDIVLYLEARRTYKLLVVGCKRRDYDLAFRGTAMNRFEMGTFDVTATLANFDLHPKTANQTPEFYTCVCRVDGTETEAFLPDKTELLTGELTRIVSGLSVTITDIPTYVESISLIAENLTISSTAVTGSVVLFQDTGRNEDSLLATQVPTEEGTIEFNVYLLPMMPSHDTEFYLEVTQRNAGAVESHTIITDDMPGVVMNNRFMLWPNRALNLTGNFTKLNVGFQVNTSGINLDDPAWDGIGYGPA